MPNELEKRIAKIESELVALRGQVAAASAEAQRASKRYFASCPGCRKSFDLLVNHYSIGLFDNLVYVRCPHCRKTMPVVDQGDGDIALVPG